MPQDVDLYISLGSVEDDGIHEFTPEYKKKKSSLAKHKKSGDKSGQVTETLRFKKMKMSDTSNSAENKSKDE